MKIINTVKKIILQNRELKGIPKFQTIILSQEELILKNQLFNEIKKEHSNYIRHISTPDMAMSIELAEFLIDYCIKKKPNYLIDLGSGFSSYLFRTYKKLINPDAIVYSIDDDENWLLKTQDYLQKHALNSENLFSLDQIVSQNPMNYFDLVLLDLNYVEKRQHFIKFSKDIKNDQGVVIIDDVHKIEFLRQVKEKVKIQSLANIKNKTIDNFGRFAILMK